jgi:hypothetical protein
MKKKLRKEKQEKNTIENFYEDYWELYSKVEKSYP